MRQALIVAAACVAVAIVGCNCGGNACDRLAAVDLAKKAGNCSVAGVTLVSKGQCTSAIPSCSAADQAALDAMAACLDKLSTCSAASQAAWESERAACLARAGTLSEPCRNAMFGGVLPGQDGGSDGGVDGGVDAGRQPVTDGGGAVELVVVADESTYALAWTARQRGVVTRWEINAENAIGLRFPEVFVPGGSLTYEERDAGVGAKKSFFIVGLDERNEVVLGVPFTSDGGQVDAGCQGPLDCPVDRVCNLGNCVVQNCNPQSSTCPNGYSCSSFKCIRGFGDAGTIDAGTSDGGAEQPKPFISSMVTVTTGKPGFSPEIFVSRFGVQANAPEVVAFDSARQFVAMEQENQLFGHFTQNRGKDFVTNDLAQTVKIDDVGKRIRLAFQPSNQTLYACYNVGFGVRVRKSPDLGRSWPRDEVIDIVNPDPGDGGFPVFIQDCDIAPWVDGDAIMVTTEGDDLIVRVVTDTPFAASAPSVAFRSSTADGGIYAPQRPSIATAPEDFIVHIGFTVSRATAGGATDTEPYAVYRDPGTGGTFTAPVRLNAAPSALAQDYVDVAIEPKRSCTRDEDCTAMTPGGQPISSTCVQATKRCARRAIAAFTSHEPDGVHNTVYVSLWNARTKEWITGSDLGVFVKDRTQTSFLVVPDRSITDPWDAFAPRVVVTPAGRAFLGFIAGRSRGASPSEYRAYVVPFDFDRQSPLSNGTGWFVPPATAAGSTLAVDPSALGGTALMPSWLGLAADSQISVYVTYVEGTGPTREDPNRGILVTRP